MSEEILEKALNKTREIEKQAEKRMRIARALGVVTGSAIALAIDSLLTWAIINFMVGISVSFVATLGTVLLIQLLLVKVKSYLAK